MARLNEILVGRFNRSLQKLFGIKGGPPVATLAPEIMPVHLIPGSVEENWLRNWNMFSAAFVLPAVAAQTSPLMLRLAKATNCIAVVESINVSADALEQWHVSMFNADTADLGTIRGYNNLDARYGNAFKGNAVVSTQQTTFANFTDVCIFSTLAGDSKELIQNKNQEIPMAPGSALLIQEVVVNVQHYVAIRWRERFLEEGERL